MSSNAPVQIHPLDALITALQRSQTLISEFISSAKPVPANLPSLPPPPAPIITRALNALRKPQIIAALGITALGLYIVYPELHKDKKMFSTRRPDKYTTGFINPSVDCFANSNLQALSSLPVFNVYLNTFTPIAKAIDSADITLHDALIALLFKLQRTIHSTKSISVWNFLHVLEHIYNSRISRSQHDAHELLQLILETLLKEYVAVKKLYDKSPEVQDHVFQETGLKDFPEFPFASEVASSLRCMRCGKTSSVNYSPMMVYSIALPEEQSVSLDTLLKRNESEVIEDYSCLVCQIRFILATKNELVHDETKLKQIARLEKLLNSDVLQINSDVPPELQEVIETYPGIKSPKVKTIVHREENLVKVPKILIIHLSRSLFEATRAWRNTCDVFFTEQLEVKGDKKQIEEYVKHDHGKTIDDSNILPSLNPTLASETKASSEYIDNPPPEDGESEEDEAESEADANSLYSEEKEIKPQSGTKKKVMHKKKTAQPTEPALITPPPSNTSSSSVSSTYELMSVITHKGSHSIGHYECLRRKPVYRKSATTNEYYDYFPRLVTDSGDQEPSAPPPENATMTTTTELSTDDVTGAESQPSRTGSISRFRRRMSSLVGKIGSESGLSASEDLSHSSTPAEPPRHRKKHDKKLASCIKNPFWMLSDDKVSEVSTSDVLGYHGEVYMLFYEKQE